MNERVNSPISTAELERRWKAVRAAMAEQKVDVLVMQNNNDHMGGYVRYFTDIPATNGYPFEVIFPRDDLMTTVRHGNFGTDNPGNTARGIKRSLMTASFASAHYTKEYDPELALKALEPYKNGTIGLVGTHMMSYAFADHIKRSLPNAKFIEASELVDQVKCVKSEEEQELIIRTAHLQDAALRAAFDVAKPGMKDSQVAAIAQHYIHTNGGEQGIYICCSTPPGTPARSAPWYMGQRTIQPGDMFYQLVETNGPGGMFCEIGRWAVFGKVTQKMKDGIAFAAEARKFTLDMLKPGAKPKEIWQEYNAFMQRHGYAGDNRIYCHGQGYEMVERPLIRFDETMEIKKGMNIVCHPGFDQEGIHYGVCDNYLIGSNGPGDRLHQFPVEIVELG